MWDLWWAKRNMDRFSQGTSVSPAKHSTDCCTLIIVRGWYNRPVAASVRVDSIPLHLKVGRNASSKSVITKNLETNAA
jgi:hypothetical protein